MVEKRSRFAALVAERRRKLAVCCPNSMAGIGDDTDLFTAPDEASGEASRAGKPEEPAAKDRAATGG